MVSLFKSNFIIHENAIQIKRKKYKEKHKNFTEKSAEKQTHSRAKKEKKPKMTENRLHTKKRY